MIINSHWHYTPGVSGFSTSGGAGLYFLDPLVRRWWHGPGVGAATNGSFCQAVNGQWEGNPEQFLRITWTVAPTQGDGHYYPTFRNTILEHHMNRARMFAGKQVTLSWQMRSPGGAPVGLVIWRSYTNHPMEQLPGPRVDHTPGVIQRIDFTMTLPPVPSGYDVDPYSYIGVGVDLIDQTGPTIDFGPCQLNEGAPMPVNEKKYEAEKLLATATYP
ncbi:hypothetical protein [Microbacterium sp.]|uniref:hypothetical protein n=1 Tax=Microbacterium sp. TaxID=51671 RepID=UPI00273773D4|nr:hypothetical protein [Microbacterium sp.]MDP3952647.1 hypothetical protein [Microbacterium sp.]